MFIFEKKIMRFEITYIEENGQEEIFNINGNNILDAIHQFYTYMNDIGNTINIINILNISDHPLINKKVIWKNKKYTIIDVHTTSDFVMIDDKNHSIICLKWDNVELVN